MHAAAFDFVRAVAAQLGRRDGVLEIGSRNVNGTVRPLFQTGFYLGIDLRPGPGVDVVADGALYVPTQPVDTVVCCEVLEHTPDGAAWIVLRALQLLPAGGAFVLTCATTGRAPHSAVDGGPLPAGEPYANVTPLQLLDWLKVGGGQFRRLAFDPTDGDLYCWAVKATPWR